VGADEIVFTCIAGFTSLGIWVLAEVLQGGNKSDFCLAILTAQIPKRLWLLSCQGVDVYSRQETQEAGGLMQGSLLACLKI
jgi:hypothetical protein